MEKEIMNLHRRKLKYKWLVIDRDGVQNFPLSFDDEHIKRALEVETLMKSIQEEDVFGQERKIRNPIFKREEKLPYVV